MFMDVRSKLLLFFMFVSLITKLYGDKTFAYSPLERDSLSQS